MRVKGLSKRINRYSKNGKFNKEHLWKGRFTQEEDQSLCQKEPFIMNKKDQVFLLLSQRFSTIMGEEFLREIITKESCQKTKLAFWLMQLRNLRRN